MNRSQITEWIFSVATAERIRVSEIEFHTHKENPCYFEAEADIETKKISFCSNIGLTTALHELAHIKVNDHHSNKWAKALFRLHEKYLTPLGRSRADAAAARQYTAAAQVYKDKYGKKVRPL